MQDGRDGLKVFFERIDEDCCIVNVHGCSSSCRRQGQSGEYIVLCCHVQQPL
jgi:hypothetical protein